MGQWTQDPSCLGSLARFYQRSYGPDYIGILILLTAVILVSSHTSIYDLESRALWLTRYLAPDLHHPFPPPIHPR